MAQCLNPTKPCRETVFVISIPSNSRRFWEGCYVTVCWGIALTSHWGDGMKELWSVLTWLPVLASLFSSSFSSLTLTFIILRLDRCNSERKVRCAIKKYTFILNQSHQCITIKSYSLQWQKCTHSCPWSGPLSSHRSPITFAKPGGKKKCFASYIKYWHLFTLHTDRTFTLQNFAETS